MPNFKIYEYGGEEGGSDGDMNSKDLFDTFQEQVLSAERSKEFQEIYLEATE